MKFETRAIHIGEEPNLTDGGAGDVSVPIHLSSTFARKAVDTPTNGYEYSRSSNPTRKALEARLAALENAQFGLAFSSGMSAETVILLSFLKSGDHIIAFDDLYGGTRRVLNKILNENFNIHIHYVDASDAHNIEKNITHQTKMIWLETPTNPLLKLCDISAIAEMGKTHKLITVVDNTFMSPYFQNPLELGADIVVHSTTKYINGHSDSIGGAIMLNNPQYYEKLKFNQNAIGAILSPFDSYLVLRGTKTLALRMKQHEANAKQISEYLANHPKVSKVYYTGLPSHPNHPLALKQMKGFGGMLSFEPVGGLEDAKNFVQNLKLFAIAESLGGVESLIELPALMTHTSIPKEVREQIGIQDNLIRVSAGIEHIEDLLADLDQAFKKI